MKKILHDAKEAGWVMEPEAKRFLNLAGLPVPSWRKYFTASARSMNLQVCLLRKF
jgi:hypothetical protein